MTKQNFQPDYFKIKYAELLSLADKTQISEHLENINQKGDLVFLVSAVINFWMDNTNTLNNANNANIALQKLATILDHLDLKTITTILENLHEHDISDKLSEFLTENLTNLVDLYHAKKDIKALTKFCFLINFIDKQNLLKILEQITQKDISSILQNPKTNKLFHNSIDNLTNKLQNNQNIKASKQQIIKLKEITTIFEIEADIKLDLAQEPIIKNSNLSISDSKNTKNLNNNIEDQREHNPKGKNR